MLARFIPALSALDADLREVFLESLSVRWAHTSTALEGNTLTEGETFGVLRYGLTVSGKPLAHHNEVLGHHRALHLLYSYLAQEHPLTATDLNALHAAVQTSVEIDYLKPIGAWKKEPNSTLAKVGGRAVINDTYAAPEQVPLLMEAWLTRFHQLRQDITVSALDAYVWSHATFARIHPYADGNGRMARLLANLPVIEKGQLPILIPSQQRLAYIEALAQWQLASGPPRAADSLDGDSTSLQAFHQLCQTCLEDSHHGLLQVQATQQARRTISD